MTREGRNLRNALDAIFLHMDALLFSTAPYDRATVVCKDGYRLQIGFDPEDVKKRNAIDTLSVFVQDDALRKRWRYAGNPVRGKFFGVNVCDVVELILQHSGVDLKRSREATKALKEREEGK